MNWQAVCATDDLDDTELRECEAAGITVLVLRAGDEFFAYPPHCPHQEEALVRGLCDGDLLTCSKHLWQWDLRTGEAEGVAEKPIKMYPLKVEDGSVLVDLSEELTYEYS